MLSIVLKLPLQLKNPWNKIQELLEYAIELKGAQNISAQLSVDKIDSLEDSTETRRLIGDKAKGDKKANGWFKKIKHGEEIGRIWFDSLSDMDDKRLKYQYEELMSWIDGK